MPIRFLLAVSLLGFASLSRAQSADTPSPATEDEGWKVCRDEDDPTDCADQARHVATERIGHAESLRGYATACIDLIAKAVQQKSDKIAAAQAALDKYEQAKQASKLPSAGGQEAVDAEAASASTKAQLAAAKGELERLKKYKKDADEELEGPIGKKFEDLNYLKNKLDRTSFESESVDAETDAAAKFNSGVREMIEDLQNDDKDVDKDLRKIVKDQKAADPKSDCDPALKDPYY